MEPRHIVTAFDAELRQLESLIMEMGGLVETQISAAADALLHRDTEMAEKVRSSDRRVDALNDEIDSRVVQILALRQPMAEDLRSVLCALKTASSLERIGDYAKNIAKRTTVLAQSESPVPSSRTIKLMADLVQAMIHDVLDAYVSRDLPTALDVRRRDEQVDQLNNALFRELLTYMMEDPRNITPSMHLLFIAKNIERMGDHSTSVAEQVVFMVTGRLPDDERPKSDRTSLASAGADERTTG